MIKKTKSFFQDRFFQRELKKEIRTLIVVTIGFTIAFSWRQTIFDASITLIKSMFNLKSELSSSIVASLFITIIGLILILISSKCLKEIY